MTINPYSDEGWMPEPDIERSVEFTPDGLEFITYYDCLGLTRTDEHDSSTIREAFLERLLDTPGDGNEDGARKRAEKYLEARIVLTRYREEYDRMISELGPRLGHQTFISWRIVGEPEVERWIMEHRPENQSFLDRGLNE